MGENKVIEADNDPKSACEAEEICFELSKHKIFVRHITVSAYVREVLSPNDSTTHEMVLTEPPASLHSSAVSEAVSLCKRVLKPGCSFFAILDWLQTPLWYKTLLEFEFSVMPHPFVMC